jgi:hypothetical protein
MAESVIPSLSLLTQVSRQAVLVVLLLQLGYLPSARELETVLGINRRTLTTYLTYLTQLGLIQRAGRSWAYSMVQPVSEANKRLLSYFVPNQGVLSQIWAEKLPNSPVIINTAVNPPSLREREAVVIINKGSEGENSSPNAPPTSPPRANSATRPEGCSPELWKALGEARIVGSKRISLAQRADLTPQAVRLWEQRLCKDKGKAYTPGLLIFVLEHNTELPATNALGHLDDCECTVCKDFKYRDFLNQ